MKTAVKIDYLVGGPRISIGPDSNTPGPRTHIVEFTQALTRLGADIRVTLVSGLPFMKRFARLRQSDYSDVSKMKLHAADIFRIIAFFWCGALVFLRSLRSPGPSVIYERSAVMQSLTSFHARKRRALRVIEVNGIFSRETAEDRNALGIPRVAAAIERHALRRADLIVVVSRPLLREVAAFAGIDPAKITVIPNGVSPWVAEIPLPHHGASAVIGFVGSLARWQHLPEVVALFGDVAADLDEAAGRRVEFEIIGDGADRANIEKAASELTDPSRVKVLGRMSQEAAIRRMATWSIGFAGHQKSSASEMYHSPLKLYEYAGLGLDIVCTPSDDAQNIAETGIPVEVFESMSELPLILHAAVTNSRARTAKRVEFRRASFVRVHSWDARAAHFLNVAKHLNSIHA